MSFLNGRLSNKKVLVTGATGFIGSRLSQRLALEEKALVTGTGRKLNRVPFLLEAGVNLQTADLGDLDTMRGHIYGQEVIFHLAWLGRDSGTVNKIYLDNVKIVEELMRMAAGAKVSRFVFASSISAYGPPPQELVVETTPVNPHQRDPYGRSKALSEKKALEIAAETGLELVIVRPSMVYGPNSRTWTVRMLNLVKKGVPVIFGDGSGYGYPLYIDNLIDGLLLTAVHPQAAGQTFNFSDPSINWKSFFGFYARMCGRKPRRIPLWTAKTLGFANEKFNLGLPLTREWLQFYVKQVVFSIEKAEELLGYKGRISIEEGMNSTEAWLKEAGYLD